MENLEASQTVQNAAEAGWPVPSSVAAAAAVVRHICLKMVNC